MGDTLERTVDIMPDIFYITAIEKKVSRDPVVSKILSQL